MVAGKTLKITLKFQSGKELPLEIPIKTATGM
jgi:copper(I)-binding protein